MSGPAATGDLEALAEGTLEPVGWIEGSTNHAMLVEVTWVCPGEPLPVMIPAVYKPTAGERPLHDFPDGTLTRREVAAYLVSEAVGWQIVPPTVLRDGPFGEGMVQRWIEPDPSVDVIAWRSAQLIVVKVFPSSNRPHYLLLATVRRASLDTHGLRF